MTTESRPAFYALAPGGWRDYVTLLHPPYTAWHLSYVAIGAALAPHFSWTRAGAALLAFALGMGVGAHALDERMGRPLQTRIPDATLGALASISIAGAIALGAYASIAWTGWLAPFVVFGAFIVVAYNLELVSGLFHNGVWFALAWGGLPALSGYVAETGTVRIDAVAAAVYATLLSAAQRVLSTPVRETRRRVLSVHGEISSRDGSTEPVTHETLMGSQERALRVLAAATVALGLALLAMHL